MSALRIVRWVLTTTFLASILLSATPAKAKGPGSGRDDLPQAIAETTSEPVMGSEIVVSALDNEQLEPSVVYNPRHREYLVVWQNRWPGNRDIYGQRITEDGKLGSWFAIAAGPHDRVQPSVDYDPVHDRYLVAWAHDVSGNSSNWDVRGRIIPWDGPSPTLNEFVICDFPTAQWGPKVAYGRAQEEFLVVWWTAHPTVPAYVSGRRITASTGTPANAPFVIASHMTQERVFPDVAYNLSRNEYLVTYHDGLDVYGTRLQGNGAPLGGGEFVIAGLADAETGSVVFSCDQADQYLVAWQSFQAGIQYNIFARFITGDGQPNSIHQIDPSVATQKSPAITCNHDGKLYQITWQNQYSNTTGPYGIWGRMISSEKQMQDVYVLMAPTAGIQAEFTRPATAGGRAQYLTVWEHDRAGTTYQDIHGRLATPFALYVPFVQRSALP